jgi:SAM-dependent methyltransferase
MGHPTHPLAAGLAGAAVGFGSGAALAARRSQPTPVPAPPTPRTFDQERDDVLWRLLSERPEPAWYDPPPVATDLIHGRLTAADLEELERRLEDEHRPSIPSDNAIARRRRVLNFIAYYAIPEALERTGLISHMPPEDVHTMARGAVAAGGDPFLADLVLDGLDQAGAPLPEGGTVLDFGSSSGRALRMLAAARPDLQCVGCDPNAEAIAWAQQWLGDRARFFVSPQAPPLDLSDASVDAAYAISIWSHFAEAPARAWLDEMARVVRPGGALLLTTHGFDMLATSARRGLISRESLAAAAQGMLQHGHHFIDVFGEDGDWGVKDPGWGNAYLTVEWLGEAIGADWAIAWYRPAALDASQDVIVLRRR